MSDALLVTAPAPLASREFFSQLRADLVEGAHLVSWFGRPSVEVPGMIVTTVVMLARGELRLRRAQLPVADGFHSLSRDFPQVTIFERELHEQLGVRPHDHPWLKPVRFPGAPARIAEYPFYRVDGKEVHEVAVGPIHAGVIEPGHFRFMCLGELVHHLEIQLGYQHRGVERLLLERPPFSLTPLVETVAGDSSVAHAWASCDALEALAGLELSHEVEVWRGAALELERVAMHLAGLAGMCADIAFLQGAATYGRLRTTAINTSMLLCGSRFGRGWLRPGGVRMRFDEALAGKVKANLDLLVEDIAIINDRFGHDRSVLHRLVETGTVSRAQADELGLVGMAARASGRAMDARVARPGRLYETRPISIVVEEAGDCWARARLRIREIDASLRWLRAAVDDQPAVPAASRIAPPLRPNSLAVAVREGWRGEVVHAIETDAEGRVLHYKVQDPSLRNWMGLQLAVRNNEISDFPICNKSFDLSYCGHDL